MNYPLKANKYNWRSLEPERAFYSDEYTADHYDLYLTTEHIKDEHNRTHRYYRLHASHPHNIEMALAYDIKCPCCGSHVLKQVGRCMDFHTLGQYECPVCDRCKQSSPLGQNSPQSIPDAGRIFATKYTSGKVSE